MIDDTVNDRVKYLGETLRQRAMCVRDYIREKYGEKTANRSAILSNELDKSIFVRLTENSLFIDRPRGAMILLLHFRAHRRNLINCSLIPT